MRQTIHEALIRTNEIMGKVIADMQAQNGLTEDEALARYVADHRGRPQAIYTFAARFAPNGKPLVAAHNYEQRMEQLLRERKR